MDQIEFKGSNTVFAKDQPEYRPLPAHVADGVVTTCWQLNWVERIKVLLFGKFWFQQLTFGQALQPQLPSVKCPIS